MRLVHCFILGSVCVLLAGLVSCCTEEDTCVPVAKSNAAEVPAGKRIRADTGDVFHYAVNPCKLVSKSAVESFLDNSVAEPSFSLLYDIPPRLVCSYVAKVTDPAGETHGVDRLRIQVVDKTIAGEFDYPSLETPEQFFSIQAEALHDVRKDYELVEGLGVPAYREPSNGNLHLLLNGFYVQVACEISGKHKASDKEIGELERVERNTQANVRFAENYLIGRVR